MNVHGSIPCMIVWHMSSGLVLDAVDDAARLVAVASARFVTANRACQWLVSGTTSSLDRRRRTPSPLAGCAETLQAAFRLVFADAG